MQWGHSINFAKAFRESSMDTPLRFTTASGSFTYKARSTQVRHAFGPHAWDQAVSQSGFCRHTRKQSRVLATGVSSMSLRVTRSPCQWIPVSMPPSPSSPLWSKQVGTRVDSEGQKKLFVTLLRQGIEPRVFGFEFRVSNHWATSPVPDPNALLGFVQA